jgi:hypothetical protein
MRRLAVVAAAAVALMWVSAPAYAFFHNAVTNPYLHTALDLLTLAVVTAPLWTAYLWGGRRRGLLLALVAVVQLPVAVIGFVPVLSPPLHLAAALLALALTAAALVAVRRAPAAQRAERPAGETG